MCISRLIFVACILVVLPHSSLAVTTTFRPSSVPLVVQSPYISIWSPADALTDVPTAHWSGPANAMQGLLVMQDGTCLRWMGAASPATPSKCQSAMVQKSVQVYATTTNYVFTTNDGSIQLHARFRTPAASAMRSKKPDLDVLALPATWLDVVVKGTSGARVYVDVAGDLAVANYTVDVSWARASYTGQLGNAAGTVLRIGATSQTFNYYQGWDRVSWGHLHVLADENTDATAAGVTSCREAFVDGKPLPAMDTRASAPAGQSAGSDPVLAVAMQMAEGEARTISLLYDIGIAMEYFGTMLAPLYRGTDIDLSAATSDKHASSLFQVLDNQRKALDQACDEVDATVFKDLQSSGGDEYALLGSLAYRQVTGSLAVVYNPIIHEPWVFIKEISSDGDVQTVDVIFPACPIFLYAAPDLLRYQMLPLLVYANNGTAPYGTGIYNYTKPFAPHHLGHWPVCDIMPNQQEDMPMEETGNVLIMLSALARAQGGDQAAVAWLTPFWDLLESWANFLIATLPDPGNQLCTDDFEGPSPHNTNLAAKGIVGLAAYADLQKARGYAGSAKFYMDYAKGFARDWEKLALNKAGDSYKRQYDLDDSWSSKYNILWDKAMGYNLFSDVVYTREVAHYKSRANPYGTPLDERNTFTLVPWLHWISTFDNDFFANATSALFGYVNTTVNRVAMSDWYQTTNAQVVGFAARPVVGGLFAKAWLDTR